MTTAQKLWDDLCLRSGLEDESTVKIKGHQLRRIIEQSWEAGRNHGGNGSASPDDFGELLRSLGGGRRP